MILEKLFIIISDLCGLSVFAGYSEFQLWL
jgi:hypothetical protein